MTVKRRTNNGTAKRMRQQKASEGALTAGYLGGLRERLESDPTHRLVQNALTQTAVDQIALDRSIVTRADHSFSNVLDDWTVTNQKKSGRCWLFAGTNLLRVGAMKKMNIKSFEFSQNYPLFWDKLERANYFLESIIETADAPLDDRTVAFLLDRPIDDGGQWNMFVNLIQKHGLVPKTAMPETESSSNTSLMNNVLRETMRQGAKTLRDLRAEGTATDRLREVKRDILTVIHRILAVHLGEPPSQFDWQWTDKKKKFHRDGPMTPLEFAKKYVTIPIDDYVCLVHDPRKTSPLGRTYTVQYLGNVVGGGPVIYLNIDTQLMKSIAMRMIQDGHPVWFGCDVGKMMRRDIGLWDARLYDYASVYGAQFTLDKGARLDYHQSRMTHAMLFTGVDVVNRKPRRWRVENSWGKELGDKGFQIMNDSWFDEYMFEIAAPQRYLPAKLRAALKLKPIVLPPWDPMGALAE